MFSCRAGTIAADGTASAAREIARRINRSPSRTGFVPWQFTYRFKRRANYVLSSIL